MEARRIEAEGVAARLALQQESQEARERELRQREKTAERHAREQARAFLLEARTRVEEAVGRAQAASDTAAREARRIVEEGIAGLRKAEAEREEPPGRGSPGDVPVGARVRLATGGAGRVVEVRPDGKLVVVAGAVRMVVAPDAVTAAAGNDAAERRRERDQPLRPSADQPGPTEVDLRGMTGDEAEAATIAAVDAAVLAEHPILRIIHGMGTGVVRDRVHRVVRGDRRIARWALAPREQGGSGVTIVEFAG